MMNEEDKKAAHQAAADLVPAQLEGTAMNAVEKLAMRSAAEAGQFFEIVKARLLNVNGWKEISGSTLSDFVLCNGKGEPVQRELRMGDHIRIDIPGPGPQSGNGHDWVKVVQLTAVLNQETEILSITVRPAKNPLKEAEDIAHFLDAQATSTFQVRRLGSILYAEEHGRNELPNTATGNTIDKVRNTVVGWGAKLGLSYPQWKALVKGLLRND